jgi:hypothetical protein
MTKLAPSVTYSPHTRKFYVGKHQTEDFAHDSHLEPIAKVDFSRKLGDGRIEPVNHEMYRQADRAYRSGNIDETSLGNITVVALLTEVIGREWRQFFLRGGTRPVAVPKLQLDVPVHTKMTASEKVPELVAADQKSPKFTQVPIRLWKNVVNLYESTESTLKATIEPLQFAIDQAAGMLGKSANNQIATELETFTSTAGAGDWATLNTNNDFSLYNPFDDLEAAHTTITDNNFIPNTFATHPRAAMDYLTNTRVNGYESAVDQNFTGMFAMPKLPGVTMIVDPSITNTVGVFYDRNTVLLGEGPTVAEQFRDYDADANGWVIRQFLQPKKTTNNAGRKITGISA